MVYFIVRVTKTLNRGLFAPAIGPLFRVPATGDDAVAITRLESGQRTHRSAPRCCIRALQPGPRWQLGRSHAPRFRRILAIHARSPRRKRTEGYVAHPLFASRLEIVDASDRRVRTPSVTAESLPAARHRFALFVQQKLCRTPHRATQKRSAVP